MEMPLLFPPSPVDEWSFAEQAAQPGAFGETRAIRVSRSRRPRQDGANDRSGYWFGVDEYEAVVDVRTGIIIRLTGLSANAVVGSIQVTTLSLDMRADDDAFVFVPPARTRIVAAGE